MLTSESVRKLGGFYSTVANLLWPVTVLAFAVLFIGNWSRTNMISGHSVAFWLTIAAPPFLLLTVVFNGLSARWGQDAARGWNYWTSVFAAVSLMLVLAAALIARVLFPDFPQIEDAIKSANADKLIAVVRSVEISLIDAIGLALLFAATLYAWYDWLFQNHPAYQGTSRVDVVQLGSENAALRMENLALKAERDALRRDNAALQARLGYAAPAASAPAPWYPPAEPQMHAEGHAKNIRCQTVNFNFYEKENHGRPAVEIENGPGDGGSLVPSTA